MRIPFTFALLPLVYSLSARAESNADASNGASIGSRYPIYNFTQLIDHGSNNSATFDQRFQLITDFFKPRGPILFKQGAESPLVPVENDMMYEAAKELGGMVAIIEHRYFGTSFPNSVNGSADGYRYLTLENVMKDAVALVNFLKNKVPGAADSKTIVSGGSYGGNLALAMRVKHPDTFYGSFASSPITDSFGPDPNNSAKFDSAIQLHNIYYDASFNAASKIQAAMLKFQKCALIGKNCSAVLTDMGFCSGTPNTTQWATIYSTVLNAYRFIPAFNYPIADDYQMPYPFQYLINATQNATGPGEVLRIPLAMTNWQESLDQCVDWTGKNITGGPNVPTTQSYNYLFCNWYPIQELAVPEGNLLPPSDVTGPVHICGMPEFESENFNKSTEFWQNYWGTSTKIIDSTTRLMIFQGGFDRVAAIGSPSLTLSNDRQKSRVIVTTGLGHTGDIFPESFVPRGVLPALDQIRDTKVEILKSWLSCPTCI